MKVYIAAPIVNISDSWKEQIDRVKEVFSECDSLEIYDPSKHGVPNAWGMSMEEWSKCIFAIDVIAIDNCDWVIACDFGRNDTAQVFSATIGTAWEVGYAFGKNKKILIVRMGNNDIHYSVMMNGCCSNYVNYSSLLMMQSEDLVMNLFVERGRNQPDTVFD